MPGGVKKSNKAKYPGEGSSSEYKDTMMKLKNYWPQSTIDLYMSKAISLHDLDNFITDEKSLADINQVVLNMDEWYKKNPEYSFMQAAKLLKEKANIPTPETLVDNSDSDGMSRYIRNSFRNRTRYERAQEEDQYSRRGPQFEEDMSDEQFLETIQGQSESPARDVPERPMRGTRATSVTLDDTSARWNNLFVDNQIMRDPFSSTGSVGVAETVMATSTPPTNQLFGGITPEGTPVTLTRTGVGNTFIGTDPVGSSWIYDQDTGEWQRA